MSSSQKGRIVSAEARKNMSNAHKGQVAWNKGKTNIYSKETKENISKSLIKFHKDKVKKHE